jgi:hypothetical protein
MIYPHKKTRRAKAQAGSICLALADFFMRPQAVAQISALPVKISKIS